MMDPLTQAIVERQIEALENAIDQLIKHRETITDNTEEFASSDMEKLVEPLDTHILSCIDGVITLTNSLTKPNGTDGTV